MAYATVADVQARIPTQLVTLGAASQPTTAQVTTWLEAASRWIDGTLRWKYLVPVTDADDLNTLREACADLVASRCWALVAGQDEKPAANVKDLRLAAYQVLAYDPGSGLRGATGNSMVVLPNTALADTGEAAVNQPEGTFTDPDLEDGSTNARLFSIDMTF